MKSLNRFTFLYVKIKNTTFEKSILQNMNRLVIIGNGFDLAHGLPTRYKDFIDDFWNNISDTYISENVKRIIFFDENYISDININERKKFSELEKKLSLFSTINTGFKYDKVMQKLSYGNEDIFRFENEFFKIINDKNSENWVDIEREYYGQLKEIANEKPLGGFVHLSKGKWAEGLRKKVEKLNQEFEEVKNLLEKYLQKKVVEKYKFDVSSTDELNTFHNIFSPDILELDKIANWKEEFSKNDQDYIDELIKDGKQKDVKLRFLNFNYTSTVYRYFSMHNQLYKDSVYFIHGKLNDKDNQINFGFGDEMDDDYKMIENIDDNEYLKNFKSFQYFHNDTYKKLFDFIESERFEVFVIGSSCGLSDRTLLNAIFENKNCRSIKVFYHEKEGVDNFTELTQNISRHFNNKTLMRSKIVPKSKKYLMPKNRLPEI